ncbi:uncharacterized protein F54H12.2-like [Montipora capricornis]|uniref:uncharacterized protein F54H12.2-like n=1 Tax=Montipora capricornis TaxID=246305 RepID=UPI0035F1BB34
MSAAHPLSAPGENFSLHVFNVPVTDVSIVSSKWVDYEPVQTGTNPIEVVIKPLADYIDINKTELRMVLKVTKQDGTPTGGGKKYTLINNALHSIVKQFTIKINETLVTEQSDTQAYNAYIKTILNLTEQAKKSYLTKALYYKDTAGHMDEVDNTAENNIGLQKRGVFTNNGAEVGLVGVPLYDIFNVDKLLLDGLEIKVKVDLNSDTFVLMGDQLFDLQGVRLTVNGEEMPYSALELTGGKKIDGYNTLFSGSGDMNCGHGLDIDRLDWENGYGLFRFDLTPAGSGHPDHLIPHRSGNVNLYLKFGTQTETILNLIVYAEFQNQVEIDRNRRVVYDLSQGS